MTHLTEGKILHGSKVVTAMKPIAVSPAPNDGLLYQRRDELYTYSFDEWAVKVIKMGHAEFTGYCSAVFPSCIPKYITAYMLAPVCVVLGRKVEAFSMKAEKIEDIEALFKAAAVDHELYLLGIFLTISLDNLTQETKTYFCVRYGKININ